MRASVAEMRAAVAERGELTIKDVPDPTPGPGQVLVAPLACGICGSDLHFVQSQAAMPDAIPPMVLGHEFVAEVLDYGPGTSGAFSPGTIVTSVPYLDCAGGPELIGFSTTATGALAERTLLQTDRVVAVPPDVPAPHAALTEPLAVGIHAVNAAQMTGDDVALVIGCGPVGLAVITALKAAGHGPVVACDFSPARRRLAEAVGADVVLDAAQSSPYTAWADLAGPALPPSPLLTPSRRPNSVIFECVGAPGVLPAVMDGATAHTRIIVVGVCQQPEQIVPMVGTTKELALRFVFAYRPDEFAAALDAISRAAVDVGALVTATMRLDDTAAAFTALGSPDEHCKILVTP